MSVLIKMEMPTTCCNCDFMAFNPEILWEDAMGEQRGAYVCKRTGELIDNTKREDHCPLIEVKRHGRLIDADEFVKRHKDWYCENCKRRKNSNGRFVYEIGGAPCRACDIGDMIDAVDDAQTIIEADYPPSTPLEQVWTELFGEDE